MVIIRGTSPQIREEAVRAFDDAIGVSFQGHQGLKNNTRRRCNPNTSGKASEVFRSRNPGREQLAIEGYNVTRGDTRTLAENAGLDPRCSFGFVFVRKRPMKKTGIG